MSAPVLSAARGSAAGSHRATGGPWPWPRWSIVASSRSPCKRRICSITRPARSWTRRATSGSSGAPSKACRLTASRSASSRGSMPMFFISVLTLSLSPGRPGGQCEYEAVTRVIAYSDTVRGYGSSFSSNIDGRAQSPAARLSRPDEKRHRSGDQCCQSSGVPGKFREFPEFRGVPGTPYLFTVSRVPGASSRSRASSHTYLPCRGRFAENEA